MESTPIAFEIDSLPAAERVRFSICTLVTKPDQYREMLQSFEAAGFTPANCEFIYADNSQGNKCDGYSATNRFLHVARGEYVVLCHQDVRLHADKREDLERCISELNSRDPHWAVLGNAGGICPGVLAIRITDPKGENTRRGKFPARVASLDENFMVVRRAANLSVSRDLTGFHFYGTDLCMVAGILGYTSYVVDFHLQHLGGASRAEQSKERAFKSDYFPSRKRFIDKYRRIFAPRWMQNTGTTLFISGSRILNYLANRKFCLSLARKYCRFFK